MKRIFTAVAKRVVKSNLLLSICIDDLNESLMFTYTTHIYIYSGAQKHHEEAPRSVQHHMIMWNSNVLTTAARLCPSFEHSYITAATEAT